MKENIIRDKSFLFAIEVIKEYKTIIKKHKEYVLSKQFLRAGTSIGANVEESQYAISSKEFISKLYISLKEAAECFYWIKLLKHSNYLDNNNLEKEINSIISILSKIIKTSKNNL